MDEIFTLRVELPDGTSRRLPSCTLYKGKIAVVGTRGIGTSKMFFNGDDYDKCYEKYETYYRPFCNSSLFEENGLTEAEANDLVKKDPYNAIHDPRIFNCLFMLGENEGGKICINETEECQKKQDRINAERERKFIGKETPVPFQNGIFGLRINLQLPKPIWTLISKFSQYYKGSSDDFEMAEVMGYYNPSKDDVQGWFYTPKAIDALVQNGYPVTYRNYPLDSSGDIPRINQEIAARKKEERKKQELIEEEKKLILSILDRIRRKAVPATREETERIRKLPITLFEPLGISGADIYGGGKWLHITQTAFYVVTNNGMDGDDWSLNNYTTGGAGAFCVKTELPDPEVSEFLSKAKTFIEK